MSASQMPPEVETRIRALPGNVTCADCSNVNPQWASVTYGALVCLECSGQHRSLGVHLSFVRSVQMDSWAPRQISAMERSGGNAALVDFLRSRGIEKNMAIATKYNTKQAAYYRERLSRWLEGKTEPPPDPGRYDPSTGGSDAQGAEPLPGETTDQYNARQARLKEAARERMRQKFGEGGLGGVGSSASAGSGGGAGGDGLDLGSLGAGAATAVGKVGGFLGDTLGGAYGFLRNNVLENDDLHSRVRGTVGGVGDAASGAWDSLRQTYTEGGVITSLKRNASLDEGSAVSRGLGWTVGTVGGIWEKGSAGLGDFFSDGGDAPGGAPQAPRCPKGHPLRTEPHADTKCSVCFAGGTRYSCSRGCNYHVCTKCFENPRTFESGKAGRATKGGSGGMDFDDDNWGDDVPPQPEPTKEDMDRLAREMGMKLGTADAAPAIKPNPAPASQAGAQPPAPSGGILDAGAPGDPGGSPPKPKAKPKGLGTDEDFFEEFGL